MLITPVSYPTVSINLRHQTPHTQSTNDIPCPWSDKGYRSGVLKGTPTEGLGWKCSWYSSVPPCKCWRNCMAQGHRWELDNSSGDQKIPSFMKPKGSHDPNTEPYPETAESLTCWHTIRYILMFTNIWMYFSSPHAWCKFHSLHSPLFSHTVAYLPHARTVEPQKQAVSK
jgi:hypothetical protein